MSEVANNYIITISTAFVNNQYYLFSKDLPELLVKNPNYEAGYYEMSLALEPLVIKKFGDNAVKARVLFDVMEGSHTIH